MMIAKRKLRTSEKKTASIPLLTQQMNSWDEFSPLGKKGLT
jgi:hypothetical protein